MAGSWCPERLVWLAMERFCLMMGLQETGCSSDDEAQRSCQPLQRATSFDWLDWTRHAKIHLVSTVPCILTLVQTTPPVHGPAPALLYASGDDKFTNPPGRLLFFLADPEREIPYHLQPISSLCPSKVDKVYLDSSGTWHHGPGSHAP